MPDQAKYSDEEVKEIIENALARAGKGAAGTSRDDLLSIGEQVGIPADVMAVAADDVLQARAQRQALESRQAGQRRWLKAHAALFAVANLLMFGVNYATTPGEWWVAFPIFFWGLALAAHTVVARWLAASPPRPASTRRLRVAGSAQAAEQEASEAEQAEAPAQSGKSTLASR